MCLLFYVKMAAMKKVYNVHVNCIDESWEKLYTAMSCIYSYEQVCKKK